MSKPLSPEMSAALEAVAAIPMGARKAKLFDVKYEVTTVETYRIAANSQIEAEAMAFFEGQMVDEGGHMEAVLVFGETKEIMVS